MKTVPCYIAAERRYPLKRRGSTSTLRLVENYARSNACARRLSVLLLAGLALFFSLLWAWPALSLAAQGDHIINNARITTGGNTTTTASVTVTIVQRTPATIEFLKYAPLLSSATPINVALGAYCPGSNPAAPFVNLQAPVPAGSSTPIDLSSPVPLTPAAFFNQGEPVFIRVTDLDQNLDRNLRETVFVTVSNTGTSNNSVVGASASSSDTEIVRLTETGPDTGVFVGYIQSVSGYASSYNGTLTVASANNSSQSSITAGYTDIADPSDHVTCDALVDPSGIVFNSSTGEPVDGVWVTLINDATGQPATVYGDDGISTFPATIQTGSSPTDSLGRRYDLPPGGYRFPFVAPGTYRFVLTSLTGYSFPSTVPDATLSALSGGVFTIVTGSRLEQFTINPGPSIRVDIPIDPIADGQLWIQKTAGKDTVSIGDFLPYELQLKNGASAVSSVSVSDTLPVGFRYIKGSTKMNGIAAADPVISADNRNLTFSVGDMSADASVTIRYVVEVAAGARLGEAVNSAIALISGKVGSNTASAKVKVKSDFLSSKSILMGQVTAGACGASDAGAVDGLEGIRVFLEDGTFVDTDKRGMFHFEGITKGSHVVQLDLDSLPEGYVVVPCEENTRFSGSAYSQFVDLQGGSMWRVDFHVAKTAKEEKKHSNYTSARGEMGLELISTLNGRTIRFQAPLSGNNLPDKELRLIVTLPEGVSYETGSGQLDGNPLPEPSVSGTTLTFNLGRHPGEWHGKATFRALLPADGEPGTMLSRATVNVEGSPETAKELPVVENELKRVMGESHFRLPEFVLHPHFPTFSAELSDQDKSDLDELARLLMVLDIQQIRVVGHTDNVRIAPRSRHIYKDNTVLSLARAESVGRYLAGKLNLPISKLELKGMGEKAPVADNDTEAGRELNRRVEIKVTTEKLLKTICNEMVKERSGEQKVEINGPGISTTLKEERAVADPAKPSDNPAGINYEEGIISPADKSILAQSIQSVRICLNSELTPHLLLDGKEIPADRIGFTMKDPKNGKVLYSFIGVDFGEKGTHTLELKGNDPFGIARVTKKIEVIRSGEIASIRMKSSEGNVADTRTPVRLQLELLDSEGRVIPSEAELEVRSGTLKPLKKNDDSRLKSGNGNNDKSSSETGTAIERVHVDDKGNALFQPVGSSGLYTVLLGTGKVSLEAETYVKPKMRDWILVGIGEGTVGYNAVSGHMENLTESGEEDRFYDSERLAFYAKGKVKGEWLITMAYDSAKGRGEVESSGLFQTIDPNTYYTLYGDATQQQYDAASARKIYVKIERDQFYAMFGDFDTGLTVTELSRYSRRMNGFKSELQGKNVEANVFATETPQAYVRDEIRGDGTSGIYHLSRKDIVSNSDKITIETRDRFHSEIIIESRSMSRYLDYSIDYDAGSIYFKEPISSRDESFNPIYIVAEYEIENGDTGALTYGGRLGAKLIDNKLKAGVSYIHEGEVNAGGDSYGFDASCKLGAGITMKGEFAHTETSYGSTSRNGDAWLAEFEQRLKMLEYKAYYREQQEGFGLGQQNGSENGTRKYGLDAAYKPFSFLGLSAQYYRQDNLSTGSEREVFEGKSTFTSGAYSAWLGGRHANDSFTDGSDKSSDQLIFGGSWLTLNKRLTLRAEHDQSIGSNDNSDYPTRTTFGADYKINEKVTLFAQQEITTGTSANTNTTNAGVKTIPWKGGNFNTSFGSDMGESKDRMFALFGLKQTLKVTDKWSVDAGLDRSQTIKEKSYYQFNLNTSSSSGDSEDFTAVSLGTTYTEKLWNLNYRLEVRTSDSEDKWGITTSYVAEPKEGWGWSARLKLLDSRTEAGLHSVNGELRLGMVYRPLHTRWILLDRLDVNYDRQHDGSSTFTDSSTATSSNTNDWKIVNNLNANLKIDNRTQVSFQYGAKYALESIDGTDYSGYTDLLGIEGRYDLAKEWDIGLRGSALHSWMAEQISYSAGISVGYNVMKNAWVSLGYNFVGFSDNDFSKSDYTAEGPFVRFRFKFDQNSVKDAVSWLNRF